MSSIARPMSSTARLVSLVALAVVLATTPIYSQIVINEVDADTPGSDALEFIELYDGGIGNFPLTGITLVLFNGNATNDVSYFSIDLSGQMTDANGFFVIGNTAVVPAPGLVVPGNTIQNGADAAALYLDPVGNWPNGSLPSSVNLIDALVYDTNDFDDTALLAILTPGQPQINEGGGSGSSLDSIGRCPNGGVALITSTFMTLPPSPGALNPCGTAPYPGTQEDLRLATGINGVPTSGVGNYVKSATAGDFLEIKLESPLATFVGRPYLIVAELFGTGSPPPPVLPVLHVSLGGFFVLIDGTTTVGPLLQPQLPLFGAAYSFVVPAGLNTTSLLLEGLALDSLATNGIFATTDGYEIQLF